MNLMFSVGLIFELPVIVYFLSKMGIVTPKLMKKYRKIMIVVIFFVAAVITPPDVFSQIMVAIPLLLLYEVSVVISTMVAKKKAEK
jgi:sec-independent protein translocase protein TatC